MSFGGGGTGQIRYQVTVEDAQAASKLQSVGQQFKALGTSTQTATQQMSAVPQTFQTIVQEGNKVTTTTKQIQQTMQGTITTVTTATKANQSFGDVLKNNVLSISIAASSIIGLVTQYTQLRKAQVTAEKAAIAETTTRNRVNDLTTKLAITVQKYGVNSSQAAKGARDLAVAEEKAGLAAERNAVIQQSLSERTADFAVNILPNVIGAVGSVTQVLQGFRKAEEVSTVTTIENTGAQLANAAAMKVSGGAAASMVPPLKGVAAAEIQAGTAATTMGISMRTALIRTGIGAILVAIGTALVAFTQNWWGLRDSVNAAGVELGKIFPILTPLLNGLKEVGNWMMRLFGVDIPGSTAEATAALDEFGNEIDDTAQDAIQAAQDISTAWKKTIDNLIVIPGSKHKEWQEQFRKLRDLGFSKSGVRELKDVFFRPAGIAKSITDSLSQALQIVGKTKGLISGETRRELSNNLIDQINKGMKDAKGKLDFLGPLKEIIKAHKKDADLPKLVADWFSGLPEELKTRLKDYGLDANEIIKTLGFDPAKLSAATKTAVDAVDWGKILSMSINDPKNYTETVTSKGMHVFKNKLLGAGGGGWLANIIESIKTAFSPASLESVRQQLVAGLLAAPGNISSLVRNFVDPVLAQILNTMISFGTEMVPQWVSSTFTEANFIKGLATVQDLGTKFITALWAIISNPSETVKQINTFVTNVLGALGAWFVKSFPKTAATVSAAFNNIQLWFGGLIEAAIAAAKSIPSIVGAWILQTAQQAAAGALAFGGKVGEFIKQGIVKAVTAIKWEDVFGSGFGAITEIPGLKAQTAEGFSFGGKAPRGEMESRFNRLSRMGPENLPKKADIWGELGKLFGLGGPQTAEGAIGGGDPTRRGQRQSTIGLGGQGGPTIQLNNTAAIKAIDVVAKRIASLSTIPAMINLLNTTAIKAVDVIAKRIMSLTGLMPQVSLQNNQAIKAVDVIAKRIDSLEKLKPQISLQNRNAIKAVDVVAKRIDSLEKLKPQISLQNRDAIRAVDVIARRINDLNQTVTVRVRTVGSVRTAQHGMHETLGQDTMIQAHQGERVDIGPQKAGGQSHSWSGGGGMGDRGDIIVNNVIDMGNDRIIRSFKAKLGKDYYRFG